jgi:hypothetical protein
LQDVSEFLTGDSGISAMYPSDSEAEDEATKVNKLFAYNIIYIAYY